MSEVPDYIRKRIERPIPLELCARPGFAPVISDGDPCKACIATVGLNPSGEGGGLPDAGLSPKEVVRHCNEYFQREAYSWFKPLEQILNECGASYFEGSACHLDLVKWSTHPLWRKVPRHIRRQLLRDDQEFFKGQLENNLNIKLLLANGAGVMRELKRAFGVQFEQSESEPVHFAVRDAYLFTGKLRLPQVKGGVCVIGWRANLQSDHGVYGVTNAGIAALAKRVGELYRNGC